MPRTTSERGLRRARISAITSAVSRTSSICGQVRTSVSRRCRCGHAGGRSAGCSAPPAASPWASAMVEPTSGTYGCHGGGVLDVDGILTIDLADADPDDLLARRRDVLAD